MPTHTPPIKPASWSYAESFVVEDDILAAARARAEEVAEAADADAADEAAEDESGITPSHINMVMEHTTCTRNQAIRALRESNDDMINAVMKLSGQ